MVCLVSQVPCQPQHDMGVNTAVLPRPILLKQLTSHGILLFSRNPPAASLASWAPSFSSASSGAYSKCILACRSALPLPPVNQPNQPDDSGGLMLGGGSMMILRRPGVAGHTGCSEPLPAAQMLFGLRLRDAVQGTWSCWLADNVGLQAQLLHIPSLKGHKTSLNILSPQRTT